MVDGTVTLAADVVMSVGRLSRRSRPERLRRASTLPSVSGKFSWTEAPCAADVSVTIGDAAPNDSAGANAGVANVSPLPMASSDPEFGTPSERRWNVRSRPMTAVSGADAGAPKKNGDEFRSAELIVSCAESASKLTTCSPPSSLNFRPIAADELKVTGFSPGTFAPAVDESAANAMGAGSISLSVDGVITIPNTASVTSELVGAALGPIDAGGRSSIPLSSRSDGMDPKYDGGGAANPFAAMRSKPKT